VSGGTPERPGSLSLRTVPTETSIDESLRLARDLCLGVGAFFVTQAGTIFTNMSDVMRPEDAERRVAELALSCLVHPAAHGSNLFWSAEESDSGEGASPDSSLACVVAPVWAASTWVGLLGVVDVWLPELDQEQRAGFVALARRLAEMLPPSAPSTSGAPPPPAERDGQASPEYAEPFVGEVLDNLPDGLIVTRADGTIVLVNQTFAGMTGLAVDSVLGEDISTVLSPEGTASSTRGAPELAAAQLSGGLTSTASSAATPPRGRPEETQGERPSLGATIGRPEPGTTLTVSGATQVSLLVDVVGRHVASRFAGDCYVTLIRPATGSHRVETALQQPGIGALLDHIEEGIVSVDASGTIVVANQAARLLHGLGDDEMQGGSPFPEVTGLETIDGEPVAAAGHPLIRSMRDGLVHSTQLVVRSGDDVTYVAVSARPLQVDGGQGAVAVLRDVTEEQESREHLTHFALHDPLTGVANRYLLVEALGRMLDGLGRRGGYVSLIYLDLDNFKAINDEHGHATGDEVLRAVASRLGRAVRGEDVVARLGGDEFVVAHVTADRLSDGDAVVDRIRKVLSTPYRFGDLVLDVGTSLGWVSASSSGDTPESLMSQADRAMYGHKHRHRATREKASQ